MSEPCRVITEEQYRDYLRPKEQIKEANELIKECCKRIEFRQVCLTSFPPKFKIDDCLYNELEDYFKKYDINWGVK